MSSGVESGTGRITMFRFGSRLLALALALLCLGCSSNQAIKEVVVRDKATGQPMAGVMIVYHWVRQPSQPFHAANRTCAGIEVVLTDAQGRAKPSRKEVDGPQLVHAIYKRGYDTSGIDGQVLLMSPTSGSVTEKLSSMLTNAGSTGCSNAIMRDALIFLIAVRDEAATLASTPEEVGRVEYLSRVIALIQTGR